MNHKDFAKKMNPYTLLYVEDDAEVREHIAEFLRRYYKSVYESDSAEEGLKLYEQYQPDILLLDINLGGMSGVELATLIRQKDEKIRIVISTAYTNKEFMLQAIELGLTRYLVKPLTNEDLVKAANAVNALTSYEEKTGKKKYSTEAKPILTALIKGLSDRGIKEYQTKNFSAAKNTLTEVYNLSQKDTTFLEYAANAAYLDKDYDAALKKFNALKTPVIKTVKGIK